MLGFKLIQETCFANLSEQEKDGVLIHSLFPSNFLHPCVSAVQWLQHGSRKHVCPRSPTYWSSQLRSYAVYHLHLLIAHFLLLLAIKRTLWSWTFLVIPLNGYTGRGEGKLMFKLTITSSGKYLALWQIKPIGLYDGHLSGGKFRPWIIFLVRSTTIKYFCYFTVISYHCWFSCWIK